MFEVFCLKFTDVNENHSIVFVCIIIIIIILLLLMFFVQNIF